MKLYVTKDCDESLALLVAAKVSGSTLTTEIVPSDFKVVPYLKTTRQVPSLLLDSGELLFTFEAIALYLFENISPFLLQSPTLEQLNRSIPPCSLFGENETLSLTDMVLWTRLGSVFRGLKASNSFYSQYPRVAFWYDKVSTDATVLAAIKELGYTTPKAAPAKADAKKGKQPQNQQQQKKGAAAKPAPKKATTADAIENFLQVTVTAEQKSAGLKKWTEGYPTGHISVNEVHPKVPIPGAKNHLITSALPYVNNVPHLGNIIGAVLSADCYARYCRLRNENTLFICGTDEYGTATETKALSEGVTPQQICDKYHRLHAEIYQWFNISFDFFGRTTTAQQTAIAQDIFWKVHNNGYTVEQTVEQLYCEKCCKFLADRFVEGTCPFCGYEDARGDQCDKCSKLINPVELKNPKCKVCSASPTVRTSKHLFLDLPKLEDRIGALAREREASKSYNPTAAAITGSWLKTGLKPRCITRDLKWGTPVPHPDFSDKVFYVWFDAPIGYISITANYMKDWELWWKNPEQVTLTQFMAKDNVPFHTVVFPASLMAANDNYTMINVLDGIEYLQYEGTKFSKSRGTGVFGDQCIETNIPCDIFRCYLLLTRPESSDANFTWEGLASTNNAILLNNLGNFILRALTFAKNSFGSELAKITLTPEDEHFIALVNTHLSAYHRHFQARLFSRAFESVFSISKIGNQYLQYNQPWVLAKGGEVERARAGSVISLASNVAALLSVILGPFMPTISKILAEQLALPSDRRLFTDSFVPLLKPGHRIGTPFPLFSKIEEARVAELRAKFCGSDSSGGGAPSPVNVTALQAEIEKQGGKVRELKAAKADPATIKAEVAVLLDLKKKLPAELQQQQPAKGGKKGGAAPAPKKGGVPAPKKASPPPPSTPSPAVSAEVAALQKEIEAQGNRVRELKAAKAEKGAIDAAVKVLLGLKAKLPPELQQAPAGKKGKKK